jgi:hypothetical protein
MPEKSNLNTTLYESQKENSLKYSKYNETFSPKVSESTED